MRPMTARSQNRQCSGRAQDSRFAPKTDICALMSTRAGNCALPAASPRRGERGKAAFEIADQVVDVLEADVQAHRRPAWRPFRRRADAGAVEWNGQALEAAPRRAHAEQAELVEERVDRALRDRFEHDAEQPARAGKIASPDGVAGTAFQR